MGSPQILGHPRLRRERLESDADEDEDDDEGFIDDDEAEEEEEEEYTEFSDEVELEFYGGGL